MAGHAVLCNQPFAKTVVLYSSYSITTITINNDNHHHYHHHMSLVDPVYRPTAKNIYNIYQRNSNQQKNCTLSNSHILSHNFYFKDPYKVSMTV